MISYVNDIVTCNEDQEIDLPTTTPSIQERERKQGKNIAQENRNVDAGYTEDRRESRARPTEMRRRELSVQEGLIGVFFRYTRPSLRRIQRQAARRRARRIGDAQPRQLKMAMDDIRQMNDLHNGLYFLDEFVAAAYRESTQNFLAWFWE